MHYIGMLAIRGCLPSFSMPSVVIAMLVAATTGILAIRVAYGNRTRQNIVLGSVVFGCAVVAVHYAAMFGTEFHRDSAFEPVPVAMANHTLAIAVTVAAFVICGTFLLATTSFLTQQNNVDSAIHGAAASSGQSPSIRPTDNTGETTPDSETAEVETAIKIPFEQNKKIEFADSNTVGAIRADGHYTHLYTREGIRFCPWSITEAEKRLSGNNFHRTHRSYLVNIAEIDAYEKRKETGVCLFKNYPQLSSVPVSRNRVIGLAEVLESRPATS